MQYECRPQLNYLARQHIVGPLIADDFQKFRSPNNYSMLLMSLGYQFITDPKFKSLREQGPEAPLPGATAHQQNDNDEPRRPFRFSIFGRFAKEIKDNHLEMLSDSKDYALILHLLYTYVLNNSND